MKVIKFYLLVFGYSWIVWLLGILFFNQAGSSNLIVSIGGVGTLIGVIGYWIIIYNKEERKEYLSRLLRFQNVSLKYFLLACVFPIIIVLVAQSISSILGNNSSPIGLFDREFLERGWIYIFFLFFFGPVPEEMAWRGIALDEISKKSEINAQFIVAIMWALWHLPLFLIEGSYQYELGRGTLSFWMFFVNVIFPSFIVGWLYFKSNRSILIAILYHFFLNLTGEMFYTTNQADRISTLLTIVVALILLFDQIKAERKNKTQKLNFSQ